MADILQHRKGSTANNDLLTGALSEITHDMESQSLRVHDGAKQGGYEVGMPQAKGIVDLRSHTPTAGAFRYLKYHTTEGDGGHGVFRAVTGAAVGAYVDNNGTIIVLTGGDGSAAWVREDIGYVMPEMFGAIGDGVADDTIAIQSAINTSRKVSLNAKKTYLATYLSCSLPTILDMNEATITQGCKLARLAVAALVGDTSITVVNATAFSVGDKIGGSEIFASDHAAVTISSVNGNVITLTTPVVKNADAGTYIGDFAWSTLFANTAELTINNGILTNSRGYFFANSTANVYFNNVKFLNRGLDGFNIASHVTYYFNNCLLGNSTDVAKQTFYIINGGSVHCTSCKFASSNSDPEFTFGGNNSASASFQSNITLIDCDMNGSNTTTAVGLYSTNASSLIAFAPILYPSLTMGNVIIRGGICDNYVYSLATPIAGINAPIQIATITVQGLQNTCPFITLKNTSSTNILVSTYSDTSFYLKNTNTNDFNVISIRPGYNPIYNSCTFKFFDAVAHNVIGVIDNCIFDAGIIKYYNNNPKINSMTLAGSAKLASGAWLNSQAGMNAKHITINSANFPLSINSIISHSGLNKIICNDISSDKSLGRYQLKTYNYTNILQGVFSISSPALQSSEFNGDDWFVPVNSTFNFSSGGSIKHAVASFITTVATAIPSLGTSLITAAISGTYPGNSPVTGDYVNIKLVSGSIHCSIITVISSPNNGALTATLQTAIPAGESVAVGANMSVYRIA